mmetsp:Transcript_71109/g.107543  ORF Transcript_71109/g.107543 Transcript_71109/m.107543 type:complete len:275 (+) Transcript_71109:123-947(+)
MPARMISSTSSSCEAITPADWIICFLTRKLSYTPMSSGTHAPPVDRSSPAIMPLTCSSWTVMRASMVSWPALEARVLGMTSSASAYACTPSFERPATCFECSFRKRLSATSSAPAPGTSASSSMAFLTERSPSRTASLIWSIVCLFGPLTRIVHECGFRQSSTKVYFSSPSVSSYTEPAQPRHALVRPSVEFMASAPQLLARRSMLRRLQRRSPRIPALASMSRERGSMPFWLMSTNDSPSPHTSRLNSITCRTLSSVNLRSDSTSFSRWSAEE